MATFTPNLSLEQQGSTERASLVVLNSNLGKIDTFAGTVNGKIGKLSTPTAYSADCNDIAETCIVYVTDAATNAPENWSIMTTYVFDPSNAIYQYAVSVVYGTIKTRYKNGNGWSSWKEVATQTTWETVTPTIDSTKIVSGSVSCVKRDGIAYVQLYNVVFASSGSLSQCITGLPQAVVGGDGTFIGTNAASTAQISAAGDTWYFDPNTTYLNAITGSTYGSGHWASFMYPCV